LFGVDADPPLFISSELYADLKAAGDVRRKPLDANASVERMRSRRKLTAATRRLRKAKKRLAVIEADLSRYERSKAAAEVTVEGARTKAVQLKNQEMLETSSIGMLREMMT
jgi:phage terminase Nu1 subunit (DNA packaging protein)